jgi:hypothetical protein
MAVILATWEAEIERIMVQSRPGQIVQGELISKITRAKMDWRCGSNGEEPALQVQSPEFKPQSQTQKKNMKDYIDIIILHKGE